MRARRKNAEKESWHVAMKDASKKRLVLEMKMKQKGDFSRIMLTKLVSRRGAKASGEHHCFACRHVLVGHLDAISKDHLGGALGLVELRFMIRLTQSDNTKKKDHSGL